MFISSQTGMQNNPHMCTACASEDQKSCEAWDTIPAGTKPRASRLRGERHGMRKRWMIFLDTTRNGQHRNCLKGNAGESAER